jgi:glycosyltransferase involved in cell wall biosynthesis
LPVIITDQCNFSEVLENRAGIIIKPNAQELAEALIELLNNPQLCDEMGENGRKLVLEKFTWDKIANKMMDLYKSLLK